MRRFTTLIVLLITAQTTRPAHADAFFLGLGDLPGGGFSSLASDVSADASVVVGAGYSGTGVEAFRWTVGDGMIGLGHLPGSSVYSDAFGVSGDGRTVVGVARTWSGAHEAFRWTSSDGMTGLGYLPGGGWYGSWAWSASANGSDIVGFSDTGTAFMQAFRWTSADGMVALPDLPGGDEFSEAIGVSANGAVIVGQGTSSAGIEACRWTDEGMTGLGSLPGGEYRSMALAVSADGNAIVGASRSGLSGPDNWEMFRWTESEGMIGLGDLPGGAFNSYAYDTSADGSVLVGGAESDRGAEAAVWDAEYGMRSLYDVLTDDLGLDLYGWTLTLATGVSADGLTITGFGNNPAGDTEAWIARIPEPATVWLLAIGSAMALRRLR